MKSIIIFRYLKFISGLIIIFFPFGFDSPWNEIITALGTLIIITSGLKVRFSSKQISVSDD